MCKNKGRKRYGLHQRNPDNERNTEKFLKEYIARNPTKSSISALFSTPLRGLFGVSDHTNSLPIARKKVAGAIKTHIFRMFEHFSCRKIGPSSESERRVM